MKLILSVELDIISTYCANQSCAARQLVSNDLEHSMLYVYIESVILLEGLLV